MQYDEKYQEEISRMEWEGGLVTHHPPPELSTLQKLINKLRSWLKQTSF